MGLTRRPVTTAGGSYVKLFTSNGSSKPERYAVSSRLDLPGRDNVQNKNRRLERFCLPLAVVFGN